METGHINLRVGSIAHSTPGTSLNGPHQTQRIHGQQTVDALQRFLWGALIISFPFTALEIWPSRLKTFGEPAVILAGLLACLILAQSFLRPHNIFVPTGRSAWLLIALMLVVSLSFFVNHSINPYTWPGHNPWTKSAKQIAQWLVDGWIVYLTLRFIRTWADFRFALKCQFGGLLLILGSAFLELVALRHPTSAAASLYQLLHNGGMEEAGRLNLLAYEPSIAGDYLLAVIPLLICGSFYWKSRWWTGVWSAVAVVLFCGTFSLGCFGALFAAGLVVGVVYARRGSRGLIAGVLLLLLVVVAATVSSSKGEAFLGGRINDILESGLDPSNISDFSTRQRLANAEAAFMLFREYPLLGVGVGKSGFYMYSSYPVWALDQTDLSQSLVKNTADLPMSYNLFVVILSETGLVGAVVFVSLLISMLTDCYGAMNAATERWKRLAFAGVLFALVAQIVHYNAMSWLGMRYWFFIWGLAICAPRLLKQKDPRMLAGKIILKRMPTNPPLRGRSRSVKAQT